jgi:protein-tyrosine phosphatase
MSSKPNADCYWVEPGRLLAGAYPGHRDPEQACRKLAAFLEAGVTLFVDLTREGELQPYASLLEVEAAARDRRVRYLRASIANLDVPTPEQMHAVLEKIAAELASGGVVYVHCWGGIGRTGTVIGCHLVRGGLDGKAALARIAELRRGLDKEIYESPETGEQRRMVLGWRGG